MNLSKQLINELTNKEYRDAFVSAHIDNGIPFQIRALRKRKGWTQKELAERVGMKQERISALENPNYSKFTLSTLKKLSSAFDVALIVRFAPFGELTKWELELSPESLTPPSFDEDPYFQPPVYTHVAQGGLQLGGASIANVIYPAQPPQTVDVIRPPQPSKNVIYLPVRNEAENQMKKLMVGLEKDNETAFG